MGNRTPLYDVHVKLNAKIVDFGGWDMPLHYGSQIEEHHKVRKGAGMFDVSHMNVVDLRGANVRAFLRMLVANNVDKLKVPGRALYSCMLNSKGGVIDDLIIYFMSEDWFRVVMNAGTREKDLAWVNAAAREFGDVSVQARPDLCIIAVQGPWARDRFYQAMGENLRATTENLKPFHAVNVGELFIATTGYTGEDGFEIILPAKAAPFAWQMLHAAGITPIGLGARDTLRLEAGMSLYGTDMDETTTPLESGLEWTVGWGPAERTFMGREALEKQKEAGVARKMVGLVLEDKGMLRNHLKVVCPGLGEGEITSGSFSPTLGKAIALARVPSAVAVGDVCQVDIRGKMAPARVVKYPFVRNGKSCIDN